MCSLNELHSAMRDKVKIEINRAGSRRALADEKGIEYSRIYRMAEGDESSYPPRELFEKIFGKLNLDEDDNTVEVTEDMSVEAKNDKRTVDHVFINIDCDEYYALKKMLNDINKDLVVGFINR